MRRLVIDASVAAALMIRSQRTDGADALATEWEQHRVTAPYVFALEMRWLLLRQERREREPGFARLAIQRLARLQIALAEPLAPFQLDDALTLAQARNIGLYDAMYVMLAEENDATLATRDGVMVTVARALGVEVLDVR